VQLFDAAAAPISLRSLRERRVEMSFRKRSMLYFLGLAALGVSLSTATARADETTQACIREANQDFKDCKADCREEWQNAKDICLVCDHGCVEGCRAGRQTCLWGTPESPGPRAILRDAVKACNQTLAAAKKQCRIDNPPGPDRDSCIDAAQLTAFSCRDTAREAAHPGIKLCRDAFRACAQVCCASPS
jgi:hypothetical protein